MRKCPVPSGTTEEAFEEAAEAVQSDDDVEEENEEEDKAANSNRSNASPLVAPTASLGGRREKQYCPKRLTSELVSALTFSFHSNPVSR
jgi:hypothetical protein